MPMADAAEQRALDAAHSPPKHDDHERDQHEN